MFSVSMQLNLSSLADQIGLKLKPSYFRKTKDLHHRYGKHAVLGSTGTCGTALIRNLVRPGTTTN